MDKKIKKTKRNKIKQNRQPKEPHTKQNKMKGRKERKKKEKKRDSERKRKKCCTLNPPHLFEWFFTCFFPMIFLPVCSSKFLENNPFTFAYIFY